MKSASEETPARQSRKHSEHCCFDYSAYGLRVRIDRAIPGFVAVRGGGPVDFHLHFGEFPRGTKALLRGARLKWSSPYRTENGEPLLRVCESVGGEYFWFVHQNYEFLVDRHAREGWARWPKRLASEEMIPWMRGPLLGYVLRLHGACLLHASAVARRGRAVAFLGDTGAGKSTLAAAFAQRGFTAITDDILRVDIGAEGACVYPGYPNICLWPDSAALVCGTEQALPGILPDWTKRYLDVSGNGHRFAGGPLPLGVIYVLGDRLDDESAPRIEDLSGEQRLLRLVENGYASWLADAPARARDFNTLASLAASLPIRRVVAHANPAQFPALLDMVERDFDTLVR